MYNPETIKKVTRNIKERTMYYNTKDVNQVKMCISKGDTKIGKVLNVSLPPVLSCGNCNQCMFYCYDINSCTRHPNTVIDARARNWSIFQRDRNIYFNTIRLKLKRRRGNFYFRWHQSGEIVDFDYFEEMVKIARDFPHFTFWTYTKMYLIVNLWCDRNGGRQALPKNLHIMFSRWEGLEMSNPYEFPSYITKLKDGHQDFDWDTIYHCPGNCDVCKAAGRGCVVGETAWIDEH